MSPRHEGGSCWFIIILDRLRHSESSDTNLVLVIKIDEPDMSNRELSPGKAERKGDRIKREEQSQQRKTKQKLCACVWGKGYI